MAIIEDLGLEVKVLVDGSATAEYKDEEPDVDLVDDAPSQITTARHHYVESIDNAEFAIHVGLISGQHTGQEWMARSRDHGLAFSVALDGGPNIASRAVYRHCTSRLLQGIQNPANQTLSKFRFAPVSTVDVADKKRITADKKVAQNLGLIRVSVYRVIFKGEERHDDFSLPGLKVETNGLCLAEKALKGKAVSHGTALSAPIQSTTSMICRVDYVDTCAAPLAVFYFKYRSKEALQQELVITRPRSLSMESDLENLSPDEIRRLARERLSQMKDGRKRTASVKDEDDGEVVKPDRPFKYVKIEGGKEAVDLTEDD